MCGGGLQYDVYVPESECPEHVLKACPGGSYYTRIIRQHKGKLKIYLDYEHATLSEAHNKMEQGHERYESWLAHEEKARREMLLIAVKAFPELSKVCARTDMLPSLWINNLMEPETDAMVKLDIELPQ